ncbi:unnamed protein product, partial [Closterium sp. Naga37s-1]
AIVAALWTHSFLLLSADESVADITLWDVVERAAQPFPSVPAPSLAAITGALPSAADSSSEWPNNVGGRVCIVSGLAGIEIMDLVEIISSLGMASEGVDIPPMVYAAMVSKSAARPVREVVEDLVADHRLLYSHTEVREVVEDLVADHRLLYSQSE